MKPLFILLAFSSVAFAAEPDYTIKNIDAKTVAYDGDIVAGSHKDLLAHLTPETELLKINSPGGNAEEAMLMANDIRQRNIQLVVESACLSSCANYLFLAARSKVLEPGAFLGFHGSLVGMLSRESISQFQNGKLKSADLSNKGPREAFMKLGLLELEFLKSISVNRDLFKEIDKKLKPVILKEKREPKVTGKIVLISSDNQWEYQINELEAAQEKAMNLAKAGIAVEIKMEMKREGTASNLAYFPDRGMLEKYGVKGIASYSYPKNAVELNRRVVAKIGTGVNIFGNF
ncbi:hypothetical protein [Undibacterium pigrum]|uniref:ClpP protease-like protein n=1 Tax=Undibacterium pigrum TaxID=401470 RepID=A0A318IVK6_9BURK|nr:hypothetical protein [Undibacterium pigrum]PXX33711.1 hypothetical protein DFR42_1297 [Undibacterium pigrum]